MKKILMQLILFLIPKRSWRRVARPYVRSISVLDLINFLKFAKLDVAAKSVLIIEPNNCHNEVIPGYAFYFHNLGYDITIITNSWNKSKDLFCKANFKVSRFYFNHVLFKMFSKLNVIKKFKTILVTSSSYYEITTPNCLVPQTLDLLKLRDLKNVLLVEHELNAVKKYDEQTLIKEQRLLTLWNFGQGISVNPHYFGEIEEHKKNTLTDFVVVGGIEPHRKNHQLLINAVKKLLLDGYKNFKITVIGKGHIKHLPYELHDCFDFKGKVSFKEMYEAMNKADFYLPLLDPNSKEHERYISTGVTGSIQLILGFHKVPVIQNKFAKFYNFDDNNAVTFENDFAKALKKAIDMTPHEYEEKLKQIQKTQKNIQKLSQVSINNLIRG